MLTDKGVKAAGIGRHGDGGGLYLEVKPASRGGARKAWLLRFQVNKQRRVIGLGSYPAVSLADARAKAAQPTGPMLRQNVGKGPAPAPTPRAQQPKHSVMQAPENPQPVSEGGQRGSDTL